MPLSPASPSTTYPDNALTIQGLGKIYAGTSKRPPKPALEGIDLTVPRGSLFGLLGPNGAGKSTLINTLAGLVMKTSGSVKIWDIDIDKNPRQSRAAIGVVPQELNLDSFFTPLELLDLQSGLYGVPKKETRSIELLNLVGLGDKLHSPSRTLSGGMRRRLMIAKAMVHSPPILVLDEPTAGVDIELRQNLWAMVRELNQSGVTILLTTHYLEEAEQLCDTIAIINHGKLITSAPKTELLSSLDSKSLTVTLATDCRAPPDSLLPWNPFLLNPRQMRLEYHKSRHEVGQILETLRLAGLGITDISTAEASLEDVFLHLTRTKIAA